jgi:hypothetical protein
MPTTPVAVITWLDPPEQTDYAVGSAVTWHAAFADRITRQPVNPDIVTFSSSNPPAVSAPTSAVPTNDSTGQYHLDFPITSPGTWLLLVQAQGLPGNVPVGSASLKISAFDEGL